MAVVAIAAPSRANAVSQRLFDSLIATFDVASINLGIRMGYYKALAQIGEANSIELAIHVDANERYTREWLEHQAVSGFLDVALPSDNGKERRYRLGPDLEPIFTDESGEQAILHFLRSGWASVMAFDDVAGVFRSGKGLPFGHYGDDMRIGQALGTRWGYMNDLVNDWLPAMPDVHQRLLENPQARIADIGFGAGWSSIALARAYPNAHVHGLELDVASVELANRLAEQEGVADRVTFIVQDAGDPILKGTYDFACAFECVHDMANPIEVLAAMRGLVGSGGTVLIVDENVNDTFEAPGSDVERLFYGYSIFHCLPGSMDGTHPAGTGTVMRQATLREYATKAGFAAVDLLPIENDFFRFYRLTA
jgi:2-polyprenyl-3-methyl-5-hydroxy-6-metoxy-1,4-benzoquinol methylase